MAARKSTVEQQMQRLRLKKEELDLRVKVQEHRERLRNVKQQLRGVGGRIR
jgi:hypothetical protein